MRCPLVRRKSCAQMLDDERLRLTTEHQSQINRMQAAQEQARLELELLSSQYEWAEKLQAAFHRSALAGVNQVVLTIGLFKNTVAINSEYREEGQVKKAISTGDIKNIGEIIIKTLP